MAELRQAFFVASRRRHTRFKCDWSSDVCSSDLIEAHVCVSQTVHDLLEDGREVHVAVDAVGSRHAIDCEYGLRKMESSGAILTTVEAALLELCGEAGTPEFKAVQKVIM